MSGFNNSILGGLSTLIRAAIKSPNYVLGTSGWSINKDGSAEFNSVIVRGAIFVVGTTASVTIDAATGILTVTSTTAGFNVVTDGTKVALNDPNAINSPGLSWQPSPFALSLTGPDQGSGSAVLKMLAATAAKGAHAVYTSSDGNTYDTGRLTQKATGTPIGITGSSVAIAGLSASLGVGTYHIHAIAYVSNTVTAVGTPGFTPVFSGTASPKYYRLRSHQLNTSTVVLTSSTNTTLAKLDTQSMSVSAIYEVDMEIWLTVSVAGTLTLQVIEDAGTGSLTIIDPSFWEVFPVV